MCRNDAAREEVLRDRGDRSLHSKKGETQEMCTRAGFSPPPDLVTPLHRRLTQRLSAVKGVV